MVNRRLLLWFLLFLFVLGIVRPHSVSASVDIVYFRSVSNQNSITLEWGTETELDLLGFQIYRGPDSNLSNAAAISPLIPASGTPPTGGDDYSFDDTSVIAGSLYYYWLVSIDLSDTNPSQYSYEGPLSATTLGGTVITTPPPTTVGTTPTSPTRTPTPTLTPAGSTPLPTTTTGATSASASPTSTLQPSPTVEIDLSPTRIPAGTFPQPPTPTRFVFPATATAAAPPSANGTPASNSGDSTTGGTIPSQGQSTPEGGGGTTGNGIPAPLGEATPTTALASLGAEEIGPVAQDPNQVDVIGQQDASTSSGQLPAPATASTPTSTLPRISPLVIMGLMVGVVFTFGGAITVLFMLRRK